MKRIIFRFFFFTKNFDIILKLLLFAYIEIGNQNIILNNLLIVDDY